MDAGVLGTLGGLIASIIVAVGGALYARKKGLPAINAEIEKRTNDLAKALRDQLDDMSKDFTACKARLVSVELDNARLERRFDGLYDELKAYQKAHP